MPLRYCTSVEINKMKLKEKTKGEMNSQNKKPKNMLLH